MSNKQTFDFLESVQPGMGLKTGDLPKGDKTPYFANGLPGVVINGYFFPITDLDAYRELFPDYEGVPYSELSAPPEGTEILGSSFAVVNTGNAGSPGEATFAQEVNNALANKTSVNDVKKPKPYADMSKEELIAQGIKPPSETGIPGQSSGQSGDVSVQAVNTTITPSSSSTSSTNLGKPTTNKKSEFSGTPQEGKVYKTMDDNPIYFEYSQGNWTQISQGQYDQKKAGGAKSGSISPSEGAYLYDIATKGPGTQAQAAGTSAATGAAQGTQAAQGTAPTEAVGLSGTDVGSAMASGAMFKTFDPINFSDFPDQFKNNPLWNQMNNDQKVAAYYQYKVQIELNDKEKADAQMAFEEAKKYADPFFKESLKIAQSEIQQSIQGIEFSTESKLNSLQKNIKDTEEALAFQKENLSLEEQAQMSQQLMANKQQLYNLQQNMAESGLAFSSPYAQAESDLKMQQQGISQSTKQQYAKAKKAAEMQAQQSIAGFQTGITETEKAKQMALQNLALGAEAQLGSAQTPAIPGTTPLGGITGSLEEQKQSKVLGLQDIFANKQNPFNF